MILQKREKSMLKQIEPALDIIRRLNINKEVLLIKSNALEFKLTADLIKKGHQFLITSKRGKITKEFNKSSEIKKILAIWDGVEFILERIFVTNLFLDGFQAEIGVIKSKEFSEKRKLYQRLVIPIKEKVSFFSILEGRRFETSTLHSKECVRSNLKGFHLDIFIYQDEMKSTFIFIDSSIKISHIEFSDAAFACLVTLGYLTGSLMQNEGVYFNYQTKEMNIPTAIKFTSFRPSTNSMYHPLSSNPYGFGVRGKIGDKLYKLMKPLSEEAFSKLCFKVYTNSDLRAVLLMMMEVFKGSIFTMAVGMAVILETITNLFSIENPDYFVYIKQPKVSSAILNELRMVITSHKAEIGDIETKLIERINQINQVSNKIKLTKPFEMLGFELNEDDKKVIERRNDLLHGRLSLNYGNDIEKSDNEIYLIATKLYTLINVLILKQVGFSGYIINWPVYNKHVHKKKLKEGVFRFV